jgi:hypothetical protein
LDLLHARLPTRLAAITVMAPSLIPFVLCFAMPATFQDVDEIIPCWLLLFQQPAWRVTSARLSLPQYRR